MSGPVFVKADGGAEHFRSTLDLTRWIYQRRGPGGVDLAPGELASDGQPSGPCVVVVRVTEYGARIDTLGWAFLPDASPAEAIERLAVVARSLTELSTA